ncbi:hypothetical protein MB46_07015 [Arthrobacter alpinus]|nr:hypothetical protein MB46_07015 [Arthrobacter alpinus]
MIDRRLLFFPEEIPQEQASERRVVRKTYAGFEELHGHRYKNEGTDDGVKEARGASHPFHGKIVATEKNDGPSDHSPRQQHPKDHAHGRITAGLRQDKQLDQCKQ